jgi:hypothetical protein
MISALSEASLVALASTFMGVVPLSMGIVYAVWPSEHRLALMRPLSLATIFAGLSGSTVGVVNSLRFIWTNEGSAFPQAFWVGFAESLVPIFFGFGCLAIAWLCVAIGIWRRP